MKKFLFTLLFIILSSEVLANNGTIIAGKPYKRISDTNEVILSKSESEEYKLEIIKKEDIFFWLTRENRILEKTNSGCYDIYTSKQGSGMIITITNPECKKILCQNEKLCFTYSEHVRTGLNFISYYGFIN